MRPTPSTPVSAFRTVTAPPLLFRLGRTMRRSHLRGGDRLVELCGRLKLLDVLVQYRLAHGVTFGVPLFRADNCWDKQDVENYETALIQSFCNLLDRLSDVVLFDCGADIGTFSALVCSKTCSISRIFAIEPNLDATAFLKLNVNQLAVDACVVESAVSYFQGRGRLEIPDYDSSDHARFLVPGDGPVKVVTLDNFGLRGGNVAIKIDVEGGELDVLKGAAETITAAENCVITVEANPRVASRTRRDPVDCLRFLAGLRPFGFRIAETNETPDLSGQLIPPGQDTICNVVGWTTERPGRS